MRREDKERRNRTIRLAARMAKTLHPECPEGERVTLVRDLVPVVQDMERRVNLLILNSLSNVRFVYRPRLPQ